MSCTINKSLIGCYLPSDVIHCHHSLLSGQGFFFSPDLLASNWKLKWFNKGKEDGGICITLSKSLEKNVLTLLTKVKCMEIGR